MKLHKIIVTTLMVTCTSTALAWGEREQGALSGIAGLMLWQHVTQPRAQQYPQQYPYHPDIPPTLPAPGYTHRPMYKAVDIWVPECRCYRTFMVQIN